MTLWLLVAAPLATPAGAEVPGPSAASPASAPSAAAPASPAPAAAQTPPSITLPPELARILTDYENAWQAGDAGALAALFAEDGFVLMSGAAPARGRAEIERIYTGRKGALALRAFDYRVEGKVGYILGAFAGRRGDPDSGKFTLTIVKGPGGRWLIQSDMDNSNGQRRGAAAFPAAPERPVAAPSAVSPAVPAGAEDGAARALVDRALAAAGGRRNLEASPAFRWKGTAAVHTPGRVVAIAGTWRLVPPKQARVETWERLRGPESTRALVLDGEAGWTVRDGKPEPMAPAFRAHEAAQFHLYSLMRLAPLTGPGCRVTSLDPDPAGREGVRAACAGYPDADLWFDPTARLVRIVTRLTDPDSGREVTQTADLDGTMESRGVRWPKTIRLAWDGRPWFDLEIIEFEALKGFEPGTFAPTL